MAFLDYTGTDRVLMDKIVQQAEEFRVERVRSLGKLIGYEVAKAMAGKS